MASSAAPPPPQPQGCPCHGPQGTCLIGRAPPDSADGPTTMPCGPPQSRPAGLQGGLAEAVLSEFEKHCERTRAAARARKEAVAFKSIVDDAEDREEMDIMDTLGKKQPTDKYDGDVNLRTLRTLLGIIDERGWERSAHQMQFHSAFERCVSRVLYKSEWATARPAIMKHNGWDKCNSEVMISTPRRFGKTFS